MQLAGNIPLPTTKAECQTVLRGLKITGLKIHTIDDPFVDRDGVATLVIYALSRPVLHADNQMRRKAVTVTLSVNADHAHAEQIDGWIVPNRPTQMSRA